MVTTTIITGIRTRSPCRLITGVQGVTRTPLDHTHSSERVHRQYDCAVCLRASTDAKADRPFNNSSTGTGNFSRHHSQTADIQELPAYTHSLTPDPGPPPDTAPPTTCELTAGATTRGTAPDPAVDGAVAVEVAPWATSAVDGAVIAVAATAGVATTGALTVAALAATDAVTVAVTEVIVPGVEAVARRR